MWVLSDLQSLTKLESLNLEGTQVNDEALLPLLGCKMLSRLSLRSSSLTDILLHHLSAMPCLAVVCYRDAVLTNNGLQAFQPPATLKLLDLRGCWLLTEDSIQSFCKRHPCIELNHELVHIMPSNNGTIPMPRASTVKHKKERAVSSFTRPVKASFIGN